MSMSFLRKQDCEEQKGSPAEAERPCNRNAGPSEKIRRTVALRGGALAWHEMQINVMTECHDIF